jgi:hypothetical protein
MRWPKDGLLRKALFLLFTRVCVCYSQAQAVSSGATCGWLWQCVSFTSEGDGG